jgi:hypothetical protein
VSKRIRWWIGALVFGGVVILINSNSAQWVFLARVQWSALLALTILPVLAHTFGRELLIGGYDLNNRLAGFHVGLLLVLVATDWVKATMRRRSRELIHLRSEKLSRCVAASGVDSFFWSVSIPPEFVA